MNAADEVKVAIVEASKVARDSLRTLVAGTPGFVEAGAYATHDEALQKLDLISPEVVVVGLGAAGDGAGDVARLKGRFPAIQLLVLYDATAEQAALSAITAGASGGLRRDTPPARLLEALRELRDGGAPMSPAVARAVVVAFQRSAANRTSDARLTPREKETLRLLADGHSYKTAAARLGLSLDTVRFHVRNMYDKLHVHSKVEAVVKATREGLVD